MMSLFSGFDILMFNFQKLTFMFFLFALWHKNYLMPIISLPFKKIEDFLMNFFSTMNLSSQKFSHAVIFFMFMSIMYLNFVSVYSYNFPFTSQISVVLTWGFCFWFSCILISTIMNFKGFLTHLMPMGAPMYLALFLFLIELISNFIRFITLTVRLAANILAGHILMILLSKLVLKVFPLILLYAGLNMVEIFVALIQSYIFCTMVVLYLSELE